MIFGLFVIVFIIYCLKLRWKARHKIAFANRFKGDMKTVPILGHAHLFLKLKNFRDRWKVFKMISDEAIKQRGALCVWNVQEPILVVTEPVIAEICMKNCLEKDEIVKMVFIPVEGSSIVANVPIWRQLRKMLASAFSQKYLLHYQKIFSKESVIMMKQLQKVSDYESVSIFEYLINYAIDSLGGTILGINLNAQQNRDEKIKQTSTKIFELVAERISKPWLYVNLIYQLSANNRHLKECMKTISGFVQKVINEKREQLAIKKEYGNHSEDAIKDDTLKCIIDLLLEIPNCDDKIIEGEVKVLFFAGTDTSSVAMSSICILLARHPDVQEKVFNELQEVFDDSKRPVLYEDLPKLKYLEATIKEGLRLYPPVPFVTRMVDKDVVLPTGETLPKDMTVLLSVYGCHHNPNYWGDDVEQFRPDRFLESGPKHPVAYMPFSFGPRNCTGYAYAMLSMKTVLATLLRHYRLLPNNEQDLGQPIDLNYDLMLRAADDKLILRARP